MRLLLLLLPTLLWAQSIERWGMYEASFKGAESGNPFLDVQLKAVFQHDHRSVEVDGFYDGGGTYRVRFMPDSTGRWTYTTKSNRPELNGKTGSFDCVPGAGQNHGPVAVRNTYHFGYADGTPYFPFGTTCYAWTHQPDALQEQTVATLRTAPFNKMRICIFPKWYTYNHDEPRLHPFVRADDRTHFDP